VSDRLSVFHEHWQRYRAVTLHTLEFIPENRLGWRPSRDERSFAEVFAHVAATEDYYVHGLATGVWDSGRAQIKALPSSREGLAKQLREQRTRAEAELATIDGSRLDQIASVPGIPVSWPLVSWLWYVVEHEVHHKAQLAIYLRAIGVEPPFFAFVLPPGVRPDRLEVAAAS
jgi:uncharacterized damage-inducible protein DinB